MASFIGDNTAGLVVSQSQISIVMDSVPQVLFSSGQQPVGFNTGLNMNHQPILNVSKINNINADILLTSQARLDQLQSPQSAISYLNPPSLSLDAHITSKQYVDYTCKTNCYLVSLRSFINQTTQYKLTGFQLINQTGNLSSIQFDKTNQTITLQSGTYFVLSDIQYNRTGNTFLELNWWLRPTSLTQTATISSIVNGSELNSGMWKFYSASNSQIDNGRSSNTFMVFTLPQACTFDTQIIGTQSATNIDPSFVKYFISKIN